MYFFKYTTVTADIQTHGNKTLSSTVAALEHHQRSAAGTANRLLSDEVSPVSSTNVQVGNPANKPTDSNNMSPPSHTKSNVGTINDAAKSGVGTAKANVGLQTGQSGGKTKHSLVASNRPVTA